MSDLNDGNYEFLVNNSAKKPIVANSVTPKSDKVSDKRLSTASRILQVFQTHNKFLDLLLNRLVELQELLFCLVRENNCHKPALEKTSSAERAFFPDFSNSDQALTAAS